MMMISEIIGIQLRARDVIIFKHLIEANANIFCKLLSSVTILLSFMFLI